MTGLHGVLPMLVTPYDGSGAIALDEVTALVELVAAEGADGVAVGGLAAEAAALSSAERQAIVETVIPAAAGLPVVVGCTADRTDESVRLAEHAAARGAAAIMVAPPALPGLRPEQVEAHYRAVARAVWPTPLMVQDAPAFIGVALGHGFASRLAGTEPNVRYVKPETVPVADAVAEVVADPRLRAFAGHGGLHFLDALVAGAHGLIPGCDHIAGFVEIHQLWRAGRQPEARQRFAATLPLLVTQFQSLDCYIVSVKAVLAARGVIGRPTLRDGSALGKLARQLLLHRARQAGVPGVTAA